MSVDIGPDQTRPTSGEPTADAPFRSSAREKLRIGNLMELVPPQGQTALDVGSRDGYLARLLSSRFETVTALDLEKPNFEHPGIECVAGDVTDLRFPDSTFDLVLCAEVLEHIRPDLVARACAELARVSGKFLLIGVPFKQDLRLGRTVCPACGRKNPPWGHVNVFDADRLRALFPGMAVERVELVGSTRDRTNHLSTWLMDYAGNPYGTYEQDEGCVHCGSEIKPFDRRNVVQKAATFAANRLNRFQASLLKPRAAWIHILFSKPTA